ncbi:MAG TPA: FAD binding domain-containing protein [Acidiphilium sp.]
MRNFTYAAATGIEDAFAADGADIMLIAGGTELLNWFRLGIASPGHAIDIGRLEGLNGIALHGDRLSIGALATLNEIGEHPLVKDRASALGEACLKAASAQIRNRATIGGNVLQKTRCAYFRSEAPLPWGCNKRVPGSGCAARDGLNERHAIFGWADSCVAVHPSDPLVALTALDAEVEIAGKNGRRVVPVTSFHLTQEEAATGVENPAETMLPETRLEPGEIILGYHLQVVPGQRSAYVKVRERASYEYALVSAAVSVTLEDGRIVRARVALGSVAQKPWRLSAVEARLVGVVPERDIVLPILREAMIEARPLRHNGYKITMAAGAAARAIVNAAMGDVA